MAQVSLPYTLTAGTPENVNNLMSNLNALVAGVNTVDTAQIASGAVTTAKLNNQAALKVPFCQLYRSSSWTFNNNTVEKVPVASVQQDNGVTTTGTAMADVANNRIYARRSGVYVIYGLLNQDGDADAQWRNGYIKLNGTTDIASQTAGWGGLIYNSSVNPTCTYYLASGDYVELWHWNNTAGTYAGGIVGMALGVGLIGVL